MAIPKPGTVLRCAVGPCHNPAEKTVSLAGYGSLFPTLHVFLCQTCFDVYGSTLMQGQQRIHIDGHGAVHTIAERTPTITQAQIAQASATCDEIEQVCQDILKKEGYEGVTWHPHTYENGDVYTIAECSLAAKPEREQKGIFQGVSTWGPDNASPDLRESLDALATLMPERDTEDTPERHPTRSPYVTVSHVKAGKNPYPLPSIEGEEFTPSIIHDAGELPPGTTVAVNGKELAHALTHAEAKQIRYPDYLSVAIDRVSDELLDRLEEDIRRIETHPASNPEPEQRRPGWLPGDE